MNLEELYLKIEGSYGEAMSRFAKEERIIKYLRMFLRDPSFSELQTAVEAKDWDTAFRAVHTMKGVAGNMAFSHLQESASRLTEAIRGGKELEDFTLYETVCADYQAVVSAVNEYLSSNP